MVRILTSVILILLSFFQLYAADILIIGDSITLSSKECLQRKIPNSIVDAKVGRQFSDVFHVVRKYEDENLKVVVVALGTNGRIDKNQLTRLIKYLREKKVKVYFVNNNVPRTWERMNNELLDEFSKSHGVTIIDWKGYVSSSHGKVLTKDRIHLTTVGKERFCSLISSSIH